MSNSIRGKTYTLCDDGGGSDGFYARLSAVADDVRDHGNPVDVLGQVVAMSRRKRLLKKIAGASSDGTFASGLVHTLRMQFAGCTTAVAAHIAGLPLTQRWDRTLAASEEQYHLYMLEIELRNRLNIAPFRACDCRLAFLPHCLHDLGAQCRSAPRGEDYVCKGCSKACSINAVSKMLRRHGVRPYIWRTANLGSLFRRLKREGRRVGALGIACIPELVSGMRLCAGAGVPVVGIPLDANRCARWWGEFHPNSVNLRKLENLLGNDTLLSVHSPA